MWKALITHQLVDILITLRISSLKHLQNSWLKIIGTQFMAKYVQGCYMLEKYHEDGFGAEDTATPKYLPSISHYCWSMSLGWMYAGTIVAHK